MIVARCDCGAAKDVTAGCEMVQWVKDHVDHGERHYERVTDPGHVPTQAEWDQFWSDQPIDMTHPEGTP